MDHGAARYVVDQDVDAAQLLDGPRHAAVDLLVVAHVKRVAGHLGAGALLPDGGGELGEFALGGGGGGTRIVE
jgi:hypothetical protein